jgi:hypothetical protein
MFLRPVWHSATVSRKDVPSCGETLQQSRLPHGGLEYRVCRIMSGATKGSLLVARLAQSFGGQSYARTTRATYAASFFYQRRFTESRIAIYRKAQFFYRCFRGGAMGF